MKKKVSVIVPSYNHAKYIHQTINSILNQTDQDFEIIITDDGSSDHSREIIDTFTDERIKRFYFTENQGACIVVNYAIKQAQGEFIALLNSDDLWLPQKLEKQVKFLDENADIGAVFSYAQIIDEDGNDLKQEHFYKNIFVQPNRNRFQWLNYFFFNGNCLCHPSILIRKECYQKVGLYDPRYRQLPDFDMWVRLCLEYDIHIIPENLIQFRILNNEKNVSAPATKQILRHYQELSDILSQYLEPKAQKLFDNIFENISAKIHDFNSDLIPFYLCLLALSTDRIDYIIPAKQFAISTLSQLFKNQEIVNKLKDQYNISYSFLHDLTGLASNEIIRPKLSNLDIEIFRSKTQKNNQNETKKTNYLFSIILPVYNPKAKHLREAIESVINQSYPHWELCIADDASTKPYVREILIEYAQKDNRIKVVFRQENGHISRASNTALEMASGEYIALLDHDDLLAPNALYEVVKLLNEHPEADMIYSDEDKIDENNTHKYPYLKSDWCPENFLSTMYTCHLGVYRHSLIKEIGGFRVGYEGSQDYDLVLRVTEKTKNIFHIPKILYSWRLHSGSASANFDSKPYAFEAGRKAIQSAMDRRGKNALVHHVDNRYCGYYEIDYRIKDDELVSIIIPTKDLSKILNQCLESIFGKTIYSNYEVIVIDNGSCEEETQNLLQQWQKQEPDKFYVYKLDIPFNFSKINNFAVTKAKGKYLLFLNNDTEIITENWLNKLVAQAQDKEIGAVGALLLYPDNTIQHSGIIVRVASQEGDIAINDRSVFPSTKNCSAVTAACLLCRKEVFEQVGGFDENLAVAYNDVDLCLKFHQQGYRNVVIPQVKLYHYESKTRGYEDTPEKKARLQKEADILHKKWQDKFLYDYSQPYEIITSNLVNNYSVSVVVIWTENLNYLSQWHNNLTFLNHIELIFVSNLEKDIDKYTLKNFCQQHTIKLLEFDEICSCSKLKNEGLNIATGEYLIFLTPNISIRQLPLKYIINLAGEGIAGYGEVNNELNIPHLQSWAMCAKKSVLENLGGWDEEFDDRDWADLDLCYRAKLAGYSLFAIPEMAQWLLPVS